jgi:hypothetical protein
MRIFSYLNARYPAGLAHMACLIGLAMLASFPLTKNHDFGAHFRNVEVRRVVVRHTSVSQSEDSTPERVVRCDVQPLSLIPVEVDNQKPEAKFAVVCRTPLKRLLMRSKSRPSRASGQDPLV